MKISKMYIKNFRGYKEEIIIPFDNLTAFVGKNDIGKSTILEALDIFFNEGKNIVKMDKTDLNINSSSDETIIGVCFKDYPEQIIVDTSVETSLKDEYLLDINNELQIRKLYKNAKLKETLLVCNYPNNEEVKDLHKLKITELKMLAEKLDVEVEDKRKAPLLRKGIFESLKNCDMCIKNIAVDNEGTKNIWNKLKEYMPIYELFQSDRKNQDQDGEVQDPMRLMIKEAINNKDISDLLTDVFEKVVVESKIMANNTIEKMAEMNPEIASELLFNFETPSWDKVFKFSLETDQGIAVNKRGSGVRRLILLNFFRAEAERRKNERNVPHIIYAFEEPETSQHPNHQKLLIDSFKDIVEESNSQVILTTHSPSIAKMLPIESLRLIEKNVNGNNEVKYTGESMLIDIVNSLGISPSITVDNVQRVKLALCVEGKNDINFLLNINEAIPEFKEIVDLNDSKIIFIPMGGSTLQFWVNNNYLEKLNLSQVHIYDSDKGSKKPHKYSDYINIINGRERSFAFETNYRELENYAAKEILVLDYPDINLYNEDWGTTDVPELLSKITHENDLQSNGLWIDLSEEKKKKKISKVKKKLNEILVKKLSKEVLVKEGTYDEIYDWFKKIDDLLNA